jgi:enolase
MPVIKSIRHRQVLNSHVEFTTEFTVELKDGSIGSAASPQGETISIYERGTGSSLPEAIIHDIKADGWHGRDFQPEEWDAYLQKRIHYFGRNNVYSLSLALCHAMNGGQEPSQEAREPAAGRTPPRLCCNILNGGRHAYTNPVLSDFPEFLLVSRSSDIKATIEKHNLLQRTVREKLFRHSKTVVGGNPVSCFATRDNRECIDFLRQSCAETGLAEDFDLMIDASAGDLWREGRYRLSIAETRDFSPEGFRSYWMQLIKECEIGFLEDPFHEQDLNSWEQLTGSQPECNIIGDNLYSSDAGRLAQGAARKLTHGTIIKPNQAGTVTATLRAIERAQQAGQITIASHRSISTEETWISTLSCVYQLDYIKIGPLATDYSSVLRLNEIIRLCS